MAPAAAEVDGELAEADEPAEGSLDLALAEPGLARQPLDRGIGAPLVVGEIGDREQHEEVAAPRPRLLPDR